MKFGKLQIALVVVIGGLILWFLFARNRSDVELTDYVPPTTEEVAASINGGTSTESGFLATLANSTGVNTLAESNLQSLADNALLSATGTVLHGTLLPAEPFSRTVAPEGLSPEEEQRYLFLMSSVAVYQVGWGDSFYALEEMYGCSEEQLRLINPGLSGLIAEKAINISLLCENDKASEDTNTGQGGQPTHNITYVVHEGDTLFGILSSRNCVNQMDAIIAENELSATGSGSDLNVNLKAEQELDLSACTQ